MGSSSSWARDQEDEKQYTERKEQNKKIIDHYQNGDKLLSLLEATYHSINSVLNTARLTRPEMNELEFVLKQLKEAENK